MQLLALTRYLRLGSSSRVRFYQYFPYLASQGIEIVNTSFFDNKYVQDLYMGLPTSPAKILSDYGNRFLRLLGRKKFDLLWVEKELLPWLPASLESIFQNGKIPYIVDYDDAVFHRYEMHPNFFIRTFLTHKIDRVMKKADLVIAGNEYIAERARTAGANHVEILPSVVDVSRYEVKRWDGDNVFKIGWIGSPVTASFLNAINGALYELNKESNIRLVLVGAGDAYQNANISLEKIPWSEDIELSISRKFDVGIMPLPDEPFERGKCGYKLIQYMAGGVPVIASPVGVNQQIVEHGKNGFLANATGEWLSAFRMLRDDPQKRIVMGMAGRKKAEALYNLQVTAPVLFNLLKSVVRP